eukprot:6416198-Lingulodinium_polyedra.AAC.1
MLERSGGPHGEAAQVDLLDRGVRCVPELLGAPPLPSARLAHGGRGLVALGASIGERLVPAGRLHGLAAGAAKARAARHRGLVLLALARRGAGQHGRAAAGGAAEGLRGE